MTEWLTALLKRLADRDANEERRYLREGPRLHVSWSFLWLTWGLGGDVDYDPYGVERWTAWVTLGPLSFEVYWIPAFETRVRTAGGWVDEVFHWNGIPLCNKDTDWPGQKCRLFGGHPGRCSPWGL